VRAILPISDGTQVFPHNLHDYFSYTDPNANCPADTRIRERVARWLFLRFPKRAAGATFGWPSNIQLDGWIPYRVPQPEMETGCTR
jgi:hypothetical protein